MRNQLELLPRLENAKPDFNQLRTALLRERKNDYVPLYELFANPDTIRSIVGDEDAGGSFWKFYMWAGYDYVPVWPSFSIPIGSLVDTSKPYPVHNLQELREYPWPTANDVTYEKFAELDGVLPDGMRIIGQTGGPFELAEQLVGYQNLCYLLYDEPDMVGEMFDRIADFYHIIYSGMVKQKNVGAIVISDDMGFRGGTMLSATHLRTYVKPIHKHIAQIAHDANLPCILHSCGQLTEILDEWIDDVKIDAKHSYEINAMNVESALKQYGNRICILGGYDLNRLCSETPDEIYRNCVKLMELSGKCGYALGSGNSIPGYVPLANYNAMLRANADMRK